MSFITEFLHSINSFFFSASLTMEWVLRIT